VNNKCNGAIVGRFLIIMANIVKGISKKVDKFSERASNDNFLKLKIIILLVLFNQPNLFGRQLRLD
jgi:hypothetical protein